MFTRQPLSVLFFIGEKPPSMATSRHHQDVLRDPPSLASMASPPPLPHHRRCLFAASRLPRRCVSDSATPTPLRSRPALWPRDLTQSLSPSLGSRSRAKLYSSHVSFDAVEICSSAKIAGTEPGESPSNWKEIPPVATEPPEPPVPPDPPPLGYITGSVSVSFITPLMLSELNIDKPTYNWFAGAQSSRQRSNHRATLTAITIATTIRWLHLFSISGDKRSKATVTHREDLSPGSPSTVQNRCCVFLRKLNSLAVVFPPTKRPETPTSIGPDPATTDPLFLYIPHNPNNEEQLVRSYEKNQPSNFPIPGPVVDASPTEAARLKRELGQISSGLGLEVMGLSRILNLSLLGINPLGIGPFMLNRIAKIRHVRPLHIEFVHGSRVSILMPDIILLSSKTLRCFNVGIKSDYLVFSRALVLGYRVISIHGWLHDVEQTSPLNTSIFRFIAILVVIILPLSLTPGVIASSMSI